MASSSTSYAPVEHVALGLVDQLPILQIVVPFIAAPIIVLLGVRQLAWLLTFIASAVSFVISIALIQHVIDGSEISYQLGGWAPPVGIEYRIDHLSALVVLVVLVVGLLNAISARTRVAVYARARSTPWTPARWPA